MGEYNHGGQCQDGADVKVPQQRFSNNYKNAPKSKNKHSRKPSQKGEGGMNQIDTLELKIHYQKK